MNNKKYKLLIIWAFTQLSKDCKMQKMSLQNCIKKKLNPKAAIFKKQFLAG